MKNLLPKLHMFVESVTGHAGLQGKLSDHRLQSGELCRVPETTLHGRGARTLLDVRELLQFGYSSFNVRVWHILKFFIPNAESIHPESKP